MDDKKYDQPKPTAPNLDFNEPLDQPDGPDETPTAVSKSPIDSPPAPATRPSMSAPMSDMPSVNVTQSPTISSTPVSPIQSFLDEQQPTGNLVPPPKKKRKGLIISIIIVAVLVVLGGGAAFAYTFWYQNPEKVVTDSIMNALKAKTVTYTGSVDLSGDLKLKVELTGANNATTSDLAAKVTFPIEEREYSVEAGARFDKNGDLFFKVKNIQSIVDAYSESVPPESMDTVNKLIAKINDRWIKVSAEDLSQYDESASKKQTCASDAIEKYFQDDQALAEVAEVYKNNKFITIKQDLGSKDGSLGYSLDADQKIAENFYKGLKNTKVYKTLHDCDPDIKIDEKGLAKQTTEKDETETKVELWVDMWTHQITEVKVTGKEKNGEGLAVAALQPKFNEEVTVETPKDFVTLKQLQAEIEELMMSAMTAQTPAIDGMEMTTLEEFEISNET